MAGVEVVLQPVGRAPERILLYGPQNTGKTSAIAQMLVKCLGPGQTAYIVDTDNSWARILESDTYRKLAVRAEWEDGEWIDDQWIAGDGRLVLIHARGWEQEAWALEYCWTNARRGDWVVVDSITHPWDHVQSWYIERVHGEGLPEFLIDARIRRKDAGKASDGGNSEMLVEWVYINKVWSKTFLTPFVNARCHVAITAEAKALRTDDKGDSKDVRDLYGGAGVAFKPDTQRRIGANAQTVLFMGMERGAGGMKWMVNTVKDRERERLWRVEWDDMATTYLRDVAGWKMTKMSASNQDGE